MKKTNKPNKLSKSNKFKQFLNFLPDDFDIQVISHFDKTREGLDSSLFFKLGEFLTKYYNQHSIEIDNSEIVDNEKFLDSLIKRFPTLEY